MNDTTSLLLGSIISFFIAAAIGFFGKRSWINDILLLVGSGLIIVFGYLLVFGSWSEPIEFSKLSAFLLLFAPGFITYFFLPLIPGYMLGIFFKDKFKSLP